MRLLSSKFVCILFNFFCFSRVLHLAWLCSLVSRIRQYITPPRWEYCRKFGGLSFKALNVWAWSSNLQRFGGDSHQRGMYRRIRETLVSSDSGWMCGLLRLILNSTYELNRFGCTPIHIVWFDWLVGVNLLNDNK